MVNNQKGFSIYKILSAIAFIALIVVLSLPQFYNLDRKQNTENCIKNMKRIQKAAKRYLAERNEDFIGDTSDLQRFGYLKKSYECPSGGPGDKYIIEIKATTGEIKVSCPNQLQSTPLIFPDEIIDPVLFVYNIKYSKDDFGSLVNQNLSEETKEMLQEYKMVNNSLLMSTQINDWNSLMKNLKTHPDKVLEKIWNNMDASIQDTIKKFNPVLPFSDENRTAIIESINNSLKSKDFYSEELVKDIKVDKEAKFLIKKGLSNLSQLEIQRLNRLLLDASLPYIILGSEKYTRPSSDLMESLLDDINNMIKENMFDNAKFNSALDSNVDLKEQYNGTNNVILKNRLVLEAVYPKLIKHNVDLYNDHLLK